MNDLPASPEPSAASLGEERAMDGLLRELAACDTVRNEAFLACFRARIRPRKDPLRFLYRAAAAAVVLAGLQTAMIQTIAVRQAVAQAPQEQRYAEAAGWQLGNYLAGAFPGARVRLATPTETTSGQATYRGFHQGAAGHLNLLADADATDFDMAVHIPDSGGCGPVLIAICACAQPTASAPQSAGHEKGAAGRLLGAVVGNPRPVPPTNPTSLLSETFRQRYLLLTPTNASFVRRQCPQLQIPPCMFPTAKEVSL